MEALMTVLTVISVLMVTAGFIWFTVVAFGENPIWGICCLVLPAASLIFLLLHWKKAYKPFFLQLAGLLPLILAFFVPAFFY